jgi:hypothetical protein
MLRLMSHKTPYISIYSLKYWGACVIDVKPKGEEPAKKIWSVDKKLKISRLLKKKNQGQQGSLQKEEPANTGSNLQKSI